MTSSQPPERRSRGSSESGLRSDAERNRTRIVAAAREVFADEGLDVPMTAIARRAQVGIATLYRRFPTREDLVAAVFTDRMEAYAAAITTALADADPWHGFTTYVETVCAMQAGDRGFADVLTLSFPTAGALEATRDEAYRGFTELIARAKDIGRLRADFSAEDLVIVLMANAGVVAATGNDAPDAWRRLVAYLLQAFGTTEAHPLPPAPPPKALYRAMVRLGTSTRPRRRDD
ncbi:MAG TPA: helix-turn-helix domain-containing protein [Jiangellaceae bacterium]